MIIGVLASGQLGYDTLLDIFNEFKISFIFTDTSSYKIKSFCSKENIPVFIGNPRNNLSEKFLENKSCDVLISVNYIFLIHKNIIKFPSKYAINIHGSLLPKYRGRTPHVWAIINGEKKTGITAHLIDENCDTGPIIKQIEIPISINNTGADLLKKFSTLYWPLIKKVLEEIKENKLKIKAQKHSNATYFKKRSPVDGLINWKWDKEKIYNWVRAQAYPYPGAFSLIDDKKIIIDKISFFNSKYDQKIPNGTIIKIKPNLLVKCSNGIISLDIVRNISNLKLKIGQILL